MININDEMKKKSYFDCSQTVQWNISRFLSYKVENAKYTHMNKVNFWKRPKRKGETEVRDEGKKRKDLLTHVNFLCSSPWLSTTDGLSDVKSEESPSTIKKLRYIMAITHFTAMPRLINVSDNLFPITSDCAWAHGLSFSTHWLLSFTCQCLQLGEI